MNVQIQILNAPDVAVRYFGDAEGRIFLDLPVDFDLRLTKAVDDFSNTQAVSQEAALPSSIFSTHKNRLIFSKANPTSKDKQYKYSVITTVDGEHTNINALNVTSVESGQYEVELFGADWVDDLKAKLLNDIDLGTYLWDNTTIESSWSGDRVQLVIPAVCHYGGWSTSGQVSRQDLRMWFNLNELMKAAFCEVGWTFNSEHYSIGRGKYSYAYLSGEDWSEYTGKRHPLAVDVEQNTEQNLVNGVLVIPMADVYDPDGLFTIDTYTYPVSEESTKIKISFTGTFKANAYNSPYVSVPYFSIIVVRRRNGIDSYIGSTKFAGNVTNATTRDIYFECIDYEGEPGDQYFIRCNYATGYQGAPIYPGGSVLNIESTFTPHRLGYGDNNQIPVAELIDSELSAMDLFEAMAQFINGKIVTDYVSKTVYLYPPNSYEFDGNTIEAFYDENAPVDLRYETVPDSLVVDIKSITRPRYKITEFASLKDQYLSDDNLSTYNRTVDRNENNSDESKSTNKLFSPSGEIETTSVGGTAFMLAAWDNTDGDISTDIGKRIANFYGEIDQGNQWVFEGTTKTDFPYLAQVSQLDVDFIPLTFNGYSDDFYNLFHSHEDDFDGDEYSVLLNGGDDTYNKVDFRKSILVYNDDNDIELIPTSIKDHVKGMNIPILLNAKKRC